MDPVDTYGMGNGGDPSVGDAFGATLLECLEAQAEQQVVHEIVERSDGFIRAGDARVWFSEPPAWQEEERWGCDRAFGRVLDIGAGAGRHALHLESKGNDVTAIDISPGAIEVCARRGVRNPRRATLFDIRDERFETFLFMGYNLGLLASREVAARTLEYLSVLAAPEAKIVGQSIDPYVYLDELTDRYCAENERLGRMRGQYTYRIRHKNLATEWFDYLYLSLDELATIAAGTGWNVVDSYHVGDRYCAVLALAP
jgi:SAM-dependent methyltransferase